MVLGKEQIDQQNTIESPEIDPHEQTLFYTGAKAMQSCNSFQQMVVELDIHKQKKKKKEKKEMST